ncbi:vomeronasal 1 receptor monDomV1R1223 [Monodelphis domestica]|nr:vomeronasal 1 receptor monDomV1R1223 [Monodelphis domestica]
MLRDLVLGIVFVIEMGVGIVGNFFLLCQYTFTLFTSHRLRPIEYIYVHLTLANSKVLLSKGVPQTIVWFGFKNFLDPVGCKLIIYLQNVARSVSLSITCLLSGFQVISISPNNSRWTDLKVQAPKHIASSCFICWYYYLLIHFTLLGTMHNSRYISNDTRIWHLGYCSISTPASFNASLFTIVFSIPDVMCMGFMIWASAYLVVLLHRHHQQVQYIHSSQISSKTYPEKRATYAILLLVSTYVSFYSINSSLSFYLFRLNEYHSCLLATSHLLAAWFPAISPFVLIFCDSQILKYLWTLWHRNTVPSQSPAQHPTPILREANLSETSRREQEL